jgi:hypothetical protein
MANEPKRGTGKVLLHSCCAPCTIYPQRTLRDAGWDVIGYFYNPNIHPFTEFEARLTAVRDYYQEIDVPLVVDASYDVEGFLRRVLSASGVRCNECYRMRLGETARRAREIGADSFTSTLFYSKYQDHEVLSEIAGEVAKDVGVDFLYIDFRTGWEEGQRISREAGIYRQKYCGCIISEAERYQKKITRLKEFYAKETQDQKISMLK